MARVVTTAAQRSALHEMMRQLTDAEHGVHYEQRRPMQLQKLPYAAALREARENDAGVRADCSEFVTALCKWAGLEDPNGNGYNGAGYTGTMLKHLPHYHNPAGAYTGALAVFGPGTGEHVAMVYEPDRRNGDPLLCSHGQERGPLLIRLSVERQFHSAPVTMLSIAGL